MKKTNITRLSWLGQIGLSALLFSLPFSASASSGLNSDQQVFLQLVLDKVQPHFSIEIEVHYPTVAHQGQWAFVSGELHGVDSSIDWQTEASEFECDHNLDKSLGVLMRKDADEWQFEILYVCATEPLSWHLDDYAAQLPCGFLEQFLRRPHGLYPDYCPDKNNSRGSSAK